MIEDMTLYIDRFKAVRSAFRVFRIEGPEAASAACPGIINERGSFDFLWLAKYLGAKDPKSLSARIRELHALAADSESTLQN